MSDRNGFGTEGMVYISDEPSGQVVSITEVQGK